jgi:hypothetical protein
MNPDDVLRAATVVRGLVLRRLRFAVREKK